MDGRNAPAGSLYRPLLIKVIGCAIRKPLLRHQRNSSPLRVGRRNPGPANSLAAPISAFKSLFVSPTAVTKKPDDSGVTRNLSIVLHHGCGTLCDRVPQFSSAMVAMHLLAQPVAGVDVCFGRAPYNVP